MTLALEVCCQIAWFVFAWRFVPGERGRAAQLSRLALVIGVQTGFASIAWFATSVAFGLATTARLVELALGLGALWSTRPCTTSEASGPAMSVPRGLGAAFALAAIAAVTSFVARSLQDPYGRWDAWSIWNLRARFLAAGDTGWENAFVDSPWLQHADYPVLLPTLVARVWTVTGTFPIAVPIAIAAFFACATVVLLVAWLMRTRGPTPGLLAGLMLLATPVFMVTSAGQYADVPLAFYTLAFVVTALRALEPTCEHRLRHWILAGVFAGCIAWTKNEGLLILAGMLFATVVVLRGASFPHIARVAIGIAPFALALLWFKIGCAPSNDVVNADQLGAWLGRIGTPSRYATIAGFAATELLAWSKHLLVPMLFVIWITRRLLGAAAAPTGHSIVGLGLLAILVGHLAVYVITPNELEWHLETSYARLLLQVWPASLLWLFLRAPDPYGG